MAVVKSPMALLIDAINADDVRTVRELFEQNPDQRDIFTPFGGGTWLHYAAQSGSDAVINYLLESGMDIDVRSRWDGITALCSAAQTNRVSTVRLLIEKGIILDTSEAVKNPLFSAIVGQSPEAVRLILEAGIDSKVRYDSPTMHDMDAIAFALMRGERECAEMIAHWNAGGDQAMADQALVEADKIAERNAHP